MSPRTNCSAGHQTKCRQYQSTKVKVNKDKYSQKEIILNNRTCFQTYLEMINDAKLGKIRRKGVNHAPTLVGLGPLHSFMYFEALGIDKVVQGRLTIAIYLTYVNSLQTQAC